MSVFGLEGSFSILHLIAPTYLVLQIPTNLHDVDIDVTVTFEPASPKPLSWDPKFFSEVVGSWEGELSRPVQGQYETRGAGR